MKKIAFFGGTGGLGSKIVKQLDESYEVLALGSKQVDLANHSEVELFFQNNKDLDIVIVFTNYNFNSFIHKYSDNPNELAKQIAVNIHGVSQCISAALSNMRSRNYGRIILASSITVDRNIMGTGIYASCKAFYENLVRTIALENAAKGITANCIQLGYCDGGLTYTLDPMFLEQIIKQIPLRRLGSINEITRTIQFLIDTEYVTGTTIKLTGGL